MENPARKDLLEGTFMLGDDTMKAKKAYLDSREAAHLRAVARVDEAAVGAEVAEAPDVEEVEDLGLLGSQQAVSIERPSSEASSIISSKLKRRR